jgi:hypothetical protein
MAESRCNGFVPDETAWDAWRPEEVARRFAGVTAPWYVAGGWAIDLHLGAQRREHEDLEIGVPWHGFDEIERALAGCELFVVGDGLAWAMSEEPEMAEEHHQTWVRESETGRWRLDVMREPAEGNIWICRRDERIRRPYDQLILQTEDGIPYGRPEVTLLFKAKAPRPKDEGDLAAVLPSLGSEERRWLGDALDRAHPGHPWRETIG